VSGIRRREFLILLGGSAAAAWPVAARAQQPAMPVIGFIHPGYANAASSFLAAFHQGLKKAGFVEGQNAAIEYRWAGGQFERIPGLVADLIERQVAVIVAVNGFVPIRAAKAATSTIPIVFAYGGDPVKQGLVASFSRPGSNITGVTFLAEALAGKRLELLGMLLPHAKTVGFLSGGARSILYQEQKDSILEAGRALGLEIAIVEAASDRDFEAAFSNMVERQVDAFVLSTFPYPNLGKVVALAARHKLPAMYPGRGLIAAGGLMSYGADFTNVYVQVGAYTGQILHGAKPADLPVIQPTKFELVINLRTAKALGLDVPDKLLALADEVIE
jgi:putative tryptophan/tyrosine transport system substrate-binding protein